MVTARVRQYLGAVALTLFAGLAGLVVLAPASSAATRPVMDGSATPGVPTSTVGVEGENFVRYCVENYAPNSTVTVTNESTGATRTIHTNHKGAGCTKVPVKRSCRATRQVIVATGTDANGDPATSQAVVTSPPDPRLCSAAAKHGSSGHGSSGHSSSASLAFTGAAGILFMVLLGVVLIIIGTAAVGTARRRGQLTTR